MVPGGGQKLNIVTQLLLRDDSNDGDTCCQAQFGCAPGIYRTRVGFAGGTKEAPTYRSLGDHTETVELEFDPEVTSYR